jgi:hypothetical protein
VGGFDQSEFWRQFVSSAFVRLFADEKNCEEKFANGYLLGEILSKFGLQPDFAFFQDLQ